MFIIPFSKDYMSEFAALVHCLRFVVFTNSKTSYSTECFTLSGLASFCNISLPTLAVNFRAMVSCPEVTARSYGVWPASFLAFGFAPRFSNTSTHCTPSGPEITASCRAVFPFVRDLAFKSAPELQRTGRQSECLFRAARTSTGTPSPVSQSGLAPSSSSCSTSSTLPWPLAPNSAIRSLSSFFVGPFFMPFVLFFFAYFLVFLARPVDWKLLLRSSLLPEDDILKALSPSAIAFVFCLKVSWPSLLANVTVIVNSSPFKSSWVVADNTLPSRGSPTIVRKSGLFWACARRWEHTWSICWRQ